MSKVPRKYFFSAPSASLRLKKLFTANNCWQNAISISQNLLANRPGVNNDLNPQFMP